MDSLASKWPSGLQFVMDSLASKRPSGPQFVMAALASKWPSGPQFVLDSLALKWPSGPQIVMDSVASNKQKQTKHIDKSINKDAKNSMIDDVESLEIAKQSLTKPMKDDVRSVELTEQRLKLHNAETVEISESEASVESSSTFE